MNTPIKFTPTFYQHAPQLSAGSLHLWWLPLTLNESQHQQALLLLNDAQRNKYQRRNTPILKERYLAGRYFLYTLLAHYTNVDAKTIILEYSRFNKPYLKANPQPIQFNYTDTNGYGLFAFSNTVELGIDVEQCSRTGAFSSIVRKRFTDQEQEYVTNRQGNIDTQRFLAYWTRKEAYGKALGVGINFQMNQVNLHSKDHTKQLTDPDWTLKQLNLPDQHIGCLVHQGHTPMTMSYLSLKTTND